MRLPAAGAASAISTMLSFSVNAADLALPPPAVGGMASPLAAALLRVAAPSVYAQAPQQQRPAPQEAARSGVSHDVISRLRQFAPTQRRQSRAVSLPPLPRPRPAELTSTTMEPTSEELAPASVQSDQTQTPKELAPAPDEPKPTSEELAPASVQSDQTQTPKELAPAPDEPNWGPLND
jgi:hypothetical protein